LEGLLKFGEIEINHSHAGELLGLERRFSVKEPLQTAWSGTHPMSAKMIQEPALYLMVRKVS
jgi:hypothetical protein